MTSSVSTFPARKIIYFVVAGVIALCNNITFAQSYLQDSTLQSLYKSAFALEQQGKYDKELLNIYIDIASWYLQLDDKPSQDSARKYNAKLFSISEKKRIVPGMIQANLNYAILFSRNDSIAQAIEAATKALTLAKNNSGEHAVSRENIVLILGRLGHYYYEAGDVERCLQCLNEALQIVRVLPVGQNTGVAYNNFGVIAKDLKRYTEAEANIRKAIEILRSQNRLPRLTGSYLALTEVFTETKQFDSAWKYATLAYKTSEEMEDDAFRINALVNMAEIRQEQGKTQETITLAERIVNESQQYEVFDLLSDGYEFLARAYFAQGAYKKAEIFAEKALRSLETYKGSDGANLPEYTATLHKLLADIYKQEHNYEKAFYHFERQALMRDSLLSAEKQKQLNAFISINETKRKEAQLAELSHKAEVQELDLQQKNTAILGGSIGAALLVLVGVLFYRQRRLQAEQRIAQTESRLLRTRLNPHLWFNALSSVQNHLLTGANPRDSAKYLSKIASVMRQSLESSYQETVSIIEEVEFAEKYLNIQQMRLQEAFEYSLEIQPDLDPDSIQVPSMLLEPFLENTIEHGFRRIESEARSEKAHIRISFEAVESQKKKGGRLLSIRIEDNGSGLQHKKTSLESAEPEGTSHRSRAVEITKERLRLLAPKRTDDVGVTIAPREQGGVVVQIILPLQDA